MKVEKNGAGNWAYSMGDKYMEASCHHRKSVRGHSACGGCYARAMEALKTLADEGELLAKKVLAAVRDEASK